MLDWAIRPIQLKVKETLHIERTPANTKLNRNGGYELPGCWITTMKKLGGGANNAGANHVGASALTSALGCTGAQAQHPRLQSTSIFASHFTYALRMTRASSRNIGKLYTKHQVVHKESSLFLIPTLLCSFFVAFHICLCYFYLLNG